MRSTASILVPLGVALIISGCQTWGPTWSEVSGTRYNRTELNRSAVVIETVDGKTPLDYRSGGYRVARIDPGERLLTITGVPLRSGWQGQLREYRLDAKPCMRYYINAQFADPLSPSDWKPVIDYAEPIPGCRTTMAAK